jgi:bifunctional DNase/RNase
LTHDLLGSVIEALHGQLSQVVINDLRDNTFFARLLIAQNGKTIEVDSRPSDAIALAVQKNTPIFVEQKVLDQVCPRESGDQT